MQGWAKLIPTNDKVEYINALLNVGFETVDIGSFVSPKAVPQMADTGEVISRLTTRRSNSKIMVVVGNTRGALDACNYESINLLGFPFSTSPTFLQRNIQSDPVKAWNELLAIQSITLNSGKAMRVYLSMAFGNPYGDPWNEEQIIRETDRLAKSGFQDIAFSDITGEGSAKSIGKLCSLLIKEFNGLKLGFHLHSKPDDWKPKVEAAWQAGFRYFESVMGGYGGCPMSGYELLGNLDTFELVNWCSQNRISDGLDRKELDKAQRMGKKIFI